MNLEEAWQLNYTGRGIVVSILDDGLEYTHPDLQHNYVSFRHTQQLVHFNH